MCNFFTAYNCQFSFHSGTTTKNSNTIPTCYLCMLLSSGMIRNTWFLRKIKTFVFIVRFISSTKEIKKNILEFQKKNVFLSSFFFLAIKWHTLSHWGEANRQDLRNFFSGFWKNIFHFQIQDKYKVIVNCWWMYGWFCGADCQVGLRMWLDSYCEFCSWFWKFWRIWEDFV